MINYIKSKSSKTIRWASGTSTELYIFPTNSNFANNDYSFRISIATVESNKSSFTRLPNVTRTLMVLEGQHELSHKGQYVKSLAPFDQDTFQGDWQTTSQGKATNFNLMYRDKVYGSLKHIKAAPGSDHSFHFNTAITILYLHAGSAQYQSQWLEAGECLVIENGDNQKINLHCEHECDFVVVSMTLSK